jgi:hypothetical protein
MGGSGAKTQALAGVSKRCQTLIKAYIPKGKPWLSSWQRSTPRIGHSPLKLWYRSMAPQELQFRHPCQTLPFSPVLLNGHRASCPKTCFAGSEGLVTSLHLSHSASTKSIRGVWGMEATSNQVFEELYFSK